MGTGNTVCSYEHPGIEWSVFELESRLAVRRPEVSVRIPDKYKVDDSDEQARWFPCPASP